MDTMDRTIEVPEVERLREPLEPRQGRALGNVLGVARLVIGFEFLWAFFDKAFALGFGTGRLENGGIDFFAKGAAWFNGGSPTAGVVGFGLKGPLTHFYQTVTGYQLTAAGPHVAGWVDFIYMASMLLIGIGLMSGIFTKIAAIGALAWMAFFYTATAIWPAYNPVVDEHVLAALLLVIIIAANAGRYLGMGQRWQRRDLVKRHPILR
jgi:thiosulfate dehydrogenase [quinone] large subunit